MAIWGAERVALAPVRGQLSDRARLGLVAVPMAAGLVTLAVAATARPATVGLVAAVAATGVLAVRAPHAALALAVLLFAFEGVVKLLLRIEPTPLPGGPKAVGAFGLDLALGLALVGVLFAAGRAAAGDLWLRTTRGERLALMLLPAFVALSAVQVALGPDLERGLDGFRLFQAYMLVALGAAVACWRPSIQRRAAVALGIALAVAAYAALRVLVEPGALERDVLVGAGGQPAYGNDVRAAGSFSAAIGMESFLVPAVVFAAFAGALLPRLRAIASSVALLGTIALVAAYGRAPLAALVVGLGFAALVLVTSRGVRRRTKLIAVAAVMAVASSGFGGLVLVSDSWELRERAAVLVDPFGDRPWSMRPRLDRWLDLGGDAIGRPVGKGVGSVGAATARGGGTPVATDNSYVKVLVDQGPAAALVFLAGVIGFVAVVARRLRRARGERRALGLAALGGVVAFLALSATAETVEQPGKVAAWALAGLALAAAFGTEPAADAPTDGRGSPADA
ncbi:MAG TPA: hypothetical protein VF520_16790 [Thermoleophilaceae bacterium]|jgi:hypothetical protein